MNSMTGTVREDSQTSNRVTHIFVTPVAWGAIISGALAAASLSLILMVLGSALGLSSIAPWRAQTVAAFSIEAVIWLIVMQWVASAFGGYLTGRLRHKWLTLHKHEIFFRDTAHGFLAWALATLLTASLLASTVSALVGAGVKASATVAAGAAAGPGPGPEKQGPMEDSNGYFIDTLFRTNATVPMNTGMPTDTRDVRPEVTRILFMGLKNDGVPQADKDYLAQLVASRTGISQADAAKRVDDTIAQMNTLKEKAKENAEAARKTAMHMSIYIFLSMLMGAFIAATAAALGGRHRDEY